MLTPKKFTDEEVKTRYFMHQFKPDGPIDCGLAIVRDLKDGYYAVAHCDEVESGIRIRHRASTVFSGFPSPDQPIPPKCRNQIAAFVNGYDWSKLGK